MLGEFQQPQLTHPSDHYEKLWGLEVAAGVSNASKLLKLRTEYLGALCRNLGYSRSRPAGFAGIAESRDQRVSCGTGHYLVAGIAIQQHRPCSMQPPGSWHHDAAAQALKHATLLYVISQAYLYWSSH